MLKANDVISGQEGTAYAVIGGQRQDLFFLKSLEATIEKNKAEVRTIGKRGVQHKANGWSGTGTMTIYYTTSLFRNLMKKYMDEGVDTYFEIAVTNNDPSSSIGSQKVFLKGVNLDSVIIAKLDVESDFLEEEVAFTFDEVEIQSEFNAPSYVQHRI